jgi:antitoxin PrlF
VGSTPTSSTKKKVYIEKIQKNHYSITVIFLSMKTASSRVTQKGQATIPAPIRKKLHISTGDSIFFYSKGDDVIIKKAEPIDTEYLAATEKTLSEWTSPEDEEVFADWEK